MFGVASSILGFLGFYIGFKFWELRARQCRDRIVERILIMKERDRRTAEHFGLFERLKDLENDLLKIGYVAGVEFDLDGFYSDIYHIKHLQLSTLNDVKG